MVVEFFNSCHFHQLTPESNKKHLKSSVVLWTACCLAIDLGHPRYRSVRREVQFSYCM